MVEVDQLHLLRQGAQLSFVPSVIGSGTSMYQESRRALTQTRTLRNPSWTINVEKDLGIANASQHKSQLLLFLTEPLKFWKC
jgi:hypothetical protein